jgi:glutaredoxin
MTSITLYSTLDCHLCEQALALLEPLLAAEWELEYVDISDSEALIDRYGLRIPVVLRADTGAELGWPFDTSSLLQFLG